MSHGSALYIMPHVMRLGVIHGIPKSGSSEPEEIFALFKAWPRASMFAAPTMVKRLVESAADCRSENIRTIIWGGAPMYFEDALRALERFGPPRADLRAGREPDDDHQPLQSRHHRRVRIRAGANG